MRSRRTRPGWESMVLVTLRFVTGAQVIKPVLPSIAWAVRSPLGRLLVS